VLEIHCGFGLFQASLATCGMPLNEDSSVSNWLTAAEHGLRRNGSDDGVRRDPFNDAFSCLTLNVSFDLTNFSWLEITFCYY